MLYLKPANIEDIEKEHAFVANELYLHCNIDNPASLRVMIKNGGVIHHKDQDGYFVRIKLRG